MKIKISYKGLKTQIATVMLGLFFSIAAINQSILVYIPTVLGMSLMSFLYLVFGVILLVFVIYNILSKTTIYLNFLLTIVILVLMFIFSSNGKVESSLETMEFILYVVLPIFFIAYLEVDVKTLLKASIISPCLAVFNLSSIFALRQYTDNISMGTSYAFLFPIICSIAYLKCYYPKDKTKSKVKILPFIIIDFVMLITVFLHGSRGPLLCMATAFFLFAFLEVKEEGGIKLKNKLLFFVFMILFFIVVVYFWNILKFINSIFAQSGSSINFVRKLLELKSENNVLNGRLVEYSMALSGIMERPILGHGMSSFTYYTGAAYPHNFLLQLLYDGGVCLFLWFIFPFLVGLRNFIRNCKKDSFVFGIVLISYAIPSSLFTGDLWKKPILWGLFSLLLLFSNKSYLLKKQNESGGN